MTEHITFSGLVRAEGRRLRGEVVLAGARTWRNNEWLEVDPAALVKADMAGIYASWEHNPEKVLAAAQNGTLRVTRTDQGFSYETEELPNTTYADDALELVRGGYVAGTSFEIEGPKSTFLTDPDGTRVRRYTSIQRFVAVSPVRDPAFTSSTAAAFSKETTDMAEPIVEPTVTPAPTITPVPKADEKSESFQTAAAFAKRQDTVSLTRAMDNLIDGGLNSAAEQETYAAFAAEFDARARAEAAAKEQRERVVLSHLLRTGKGPKAPSGPTALYESDDYRHAFNRYIRGDVTAMEQFAQSIAGDGTQGGYMVPDGFLNRITESLKAYGGIAGIADTITTSDGQSLRWPSNNDTANSAAIAAEGSAVASGGADKVFGSVTLGAWSYDATGTGNVPLLVSKELIQDAAFDIEAFVARNLSTRIGRKEAADFAVGVGTTEPLGLFAKSADVMTATTMLAALIEHTFQVDQAYRQSGNCRWVLGDTVLSKIYNSVDGNGRPLFIPSADASGSGRPAGMLLGYPVTLDQGAAGLVAFGDIKAGYIIRYVRGVQVDVDPYTNIKSRQIAYHAWARADANVQDSAAYSVSDYAGVSADSA